MTSFRERIKRSMPQFMRSAIIDLRGRLEAPPLEAIVLHGYRLRPDASATRRLTLVIPSLAREKIFGGVATGVEIFLNCAARLDAQARIALDDFDRRVDEAFVEREMRRAGLAPDRLEILHRDADEQCIDVRRDDIFFSFNWWTTLNLAPLIEAQQRQFGGERRPLIYIVQEYEPNFYPMSSTHMYARKAFGGAAPCWGLFNSTQLHAYFRAQGHAFAREHVFEPRLPASLRPFLDDERPAKEKTILVYGRPSIARNCFPAVVEGLRLWTRRHPEFSGWRAISAGSQHSPVDLGGGRVLRSVGKLSLDDYARTLCGAGVGISLMASPHPSYPPLEMSHFGLMTLTNSYFCKDLAGAHENIVSLPDIAPDTIAEALAGACRAVEANPRAGWSGQSHAPSYLDQGPYPMYEALIGDLARLTGA